LICISNNDALNRIGVVGATAKGRRSRLNPNYSREGVRPTREVAYNSNAIPNNHTLAADIPCLNCINLDPRVIRTSQNDSEPTSVNCGDESLPSIIVGGTFLAPRTRLAASGAYSDIILVKIASTH
jgi:hypothetical protein